MRTITKTIRFEMAHVLSNYQGRCGNLHGHSYICNVTFTAEDLKKDGNDANMIVDLKEVKDIANIVIDPMDHAYAYNKNTTDPYEQELIALELKWNKRVVAFETRTTAEQMSEYILNKINEILKERNLYDQVKCYSVQLYETATGCATTTL